MLSSAHISRLFNTVAANMQAAPLIDNINSPDLVEIAEMHVLLEGGDEVRAERVLSDRVSNLLAFVLAALGGDAGGLEKRLIARDPLPHEGEAPA